MRATRLQVSYIEVPLGDLESDVIAGAPGGAAKLESIR